jgi:hypothetical protein
MRKELDFGKANKNDGSMPFQKQLSSSRWQRLPAPISYLLPAKDLKG